MKNVTRAGIIATALALIVAVPVNAQTSATSSATSTVRTNTPGRVIATPLRFNQEDFKKAVAARRIELINATKPLIGTPGVKLEARAQERVLGHLKTVFSNLVSRVGRLSSADVKISIRINEAAARGINVVPTLTLYTSAQGQLEKSRNTVEAAKAESFSQSTSTTSFESLSYLVKTTEDNIKNTAEAYRRVMQSLEAAETGRVSMATSSNSSLR